MVFFYALVLTLRFKFVPKNTLRMCSFYILIFNYDAKFKPNVMHICPKKHKIIFLHSCRNLVQIKCHKGAGTKMHKCLAVPTIDLFV